MFLNMLMYLILYIKTCIKYNNIINQICQNYEM